MTTNQYRHRYSPRKFHLNKRDKRQNFLAWRTGVPPRIWDYELDD